MEDVINSYLDSIREGKFKDTYINFNNVVCSDSKIIDGLKETNLLFSLLLFNKKPELIEKYTPYEINVSKLVEKNQWTGGTYVAIEQLDGSLDLHLSYNKISEMEYFPVKRLTFVLLHEFRHKIQLQDDRIRSVIDYPNWKNFNEYMQKITNNSEDLINHIFHELNPAEVDANIFACEIMGAKYSGSAFDINEQTLNLLNEKK